MSEFEMGTWSDRLPEWAAGALSDEERAAFERARAEDDGLGAEAELVARIRRARPDVPADLEARILEAMDRAGAPSSGTRLSDRRRPLRARWPLSTAAVLVLALGTAWVWSRQGAPVASTFGDDVLDPVAESWQFDDGVVAGGAVLEDLTDEQLASLLDEMGV